MRLEHIEVSCFRNIRSAKVDFDPRGNVLLGRNAQGKTNLIEAMYFMACGKSFRVPKFRELIGHGEDRATVSVQISGEGLPFEIRAELDRKTGKSIYKNGVKLQKLSEFLGLFRVVLFCPEHLLLVKDGPAKRRSFLDAAICQIRPYYASLLNECNKIDAQRAALLKECQKKQVSRDYVSVWDERLAKISVKIAFLRAEYIKALKMRAPKHYAAISEGKESLSLSYQSSVWREGESTEEMERAYLKLLSDNFESDRKYGFTQKGVHHDDLELVLDGYPARFFASQGQQRSIVLSLKLSEGEISKEMTLQEPVYLFDDVLSELDESRRSYITSGLAGKQVIFTGTDERDFSFVEKKLFVEKGVFLP